MCGEKPARDPAAAADPGHAQQGCESVLARAVVGAGGPGSLRALEHLLRGQRNFLRAVRHGPYSIAVEQACVFDMREDACNLLAEAQMPGFGFRPKKLRKRDRIAVMRLDPDRRPVGQQSWNAETASDPCRTRIGADQVSACDSKKMSSQSWRGRCA